MQRKFWIVAAFTVCLLIAGLSALPLAAQTEPVRTVTDDEVNEIASRLFCPVCENIPLDTCGTAACDDWRYEIRLQLESGMTEAQIVEDFVRRFGDRVVGTPMDPTLRALSLYTPWIVIAVALVAGAYVLTRRRPGNLAKPIASQTPTDQYQSLFEQDIANS